MFKGARLAKIREILVDRTQVDVSTLSDLLNVSTVTIRSDLAQLEEEGFLKKTRGGALINSPEAAGVEGHLFSRDLDVEYNRNEEVIGRIVEHLIDDDEWVFLGPGSACFHIAKALMNRRRVNIVTNNLAAARLLDGNPGAQVAVTGGTLYHSEQFLYGEMFERSLEGIHIKKAFLGMGGADLTTGYSVDDAAQLSVYNKIQDVCQELFFVIDSNRFDQTSFMRIGDLEIAKTVVSNDDLPAKYKEFYFSHGIRLFTSYEINRSAIWSEPERQTAASSAVVPVHDG